MRRSGDNRASVGCGKKRRSKACGRAWGCEGGVDIACTYKGAPSTLRFRYCLDARRRVRLLGTGVVGGDLVRAEILTRQVSVQPARHARFVRTCVAGSRALLAAALASYLARFDPGARALLDLRGLPAASLRGPTK